MCQNTELNKKVGQSVTTVTKSNQGTKCTVQTNFLEPCKSIICIEDIQEQEDSNEREVMTPELKIA